MRTWLEKVMSKPVVRKVLIAAVGSVLFYILFGFLALPPILKSVLSKNLTEALHRNVVIREIRVNPLVLSISIRGFTIAERDEPKTWVSAEEVFANLQLASVIRGGPVFSEVRIIRPYVNIIRHPDGSYNFTDLMGDSNKRQKERSSPLKYSFNNIQLADGSVDFDDAPKGTRHEIRGIQVGIPFLSNLRHHVDLHVKPSFAAVVNGKQISIEGKSKPFSPSLETTFALNISDLDIPHYLAYVPLQREYEVLSAFLDVKAVIHFTQHANRPATLTAEGDVTLKEVRVSGKDGRPMIHLPKVKAAIFPSDLAARDFHLTDLEVEAPEIDISIDDNKKVNLLSLLPEKQKDNSAKEESSEKPEKNQPGVKEPKFTVDSIRLTGGKVRFSDTSRGTPFRTQLGDLRIDVDRLGTAMGTKADTLVSFTSEAGEKVEQRGDLSLSPLGSEGTVSLEKIVLKKYAPYYADAVRFDIDAGTLDARSSYKYSKGEGGDDFRLTGLEASASGLRFRKRHEKEEFLVIPGISLKEGELDLGKKEVTFGLVSTAKGSVFVRRSAGGEMNVARLLPEGVQSTGLVSTIKAEDKPDEEKTPEKPWGIIAKEFLVDRYSVSFEDRTTDPPVEIALDRLRLKLEYLTTDGKKPGKISFSTGYNRQGTISLGGTFTVDPPSMNARLRAKSLPIGVMQPYYSEKVKILLTSGTTSAEGNVSVDAPKGKPVRASFRGELFVNDFSSLDKAHGEDFLKFANLHFGGVDVEYNPTSVAIREIALTDFYSRIIVQPDGTLNVQGIVAKDGAGGGDNAALKTAEPPPADNVARAPAIPVRIDNVTLQGGAVNFSDRYIKPNYSANLVELGGSVSGLSSEESGRADVNLRGKLGNSTPLEIVGKINPLAKDLFLDFKVDFRDMDLSTLSTYSGRYAGYGIQKGKLTRKLK